MPVTVLVALISASPAIINAVAGLLKAFEAAQPGKATTPEVHAQIAAMVLPADHPAVAAAQAEAQAQADWDTNHAG